MRPLREPREQTVAVARHAREAEQASREKEERAREAVVTTSTQLVVTTNQILAATTQQASGAQQQVAAVTEAVATVKEVNQTAEEAALRAATVSDSSLVALEVGRKGREAIEATIAGLRGAAKRCRQRRLRSGMKRTSC